MRFRVQGPYFVCVCVVVVFLDVFGINNNLKSLSN